MLKNGQVLNSRYQIKTILGEGGFGAVYKVWDDNLQRFCAIKENMQVSVESQKQFKREAIMLAKLNHPHLVRVTDYFIVPNQGQYLVMDFVDGNDLHTILMKNEAPLPVDQSLEWIKQICDALIYIHNQNPPIIHRDIKPANIRITEQGNAVLVDFGLAKEFDDNVKTTMGARGLTPHFAAPEQYKVSGSGTDAQSDIYSLGVTLYCLLTYRVPPESLAIMLGDVEPPQSAIVINRNVPDSVSDAIQKAMQIHRKERCKSVSDFKSALVIEQKTHTQAKSAPPVQITRSEYYVDVDYHTGLFVVTNDNDNRIGAFETEKEAQECLKKHLDKIAQKEVHLAESIYIAEKPIVQEEVARQPEKNARSKIISIHSAKGGTGRAMISANLAAQFALAGKRVGLVGANFETPTLHFLFNIEVQDMVHTLNDYLWGKCAIEEAAHDVTERIGANIKGKIFLIPASPKGGEAARMQREGYDVDLLNDGLREVVERLNLDYLLIYTHPDIREETLQSITISDMLIIILRPDVQDYQGTIAIVDIAKKFNTPEMFIVVNEVPPQWIKDGGARLHSEVTTKYETPVIAIFPHANEIMTFASSGVFSAKYPNNNISKAMRELADKITSSQSSEQNQFTEQPAVQEFDDALKIDPRDASAWNNKGVSLNTLGRYEEAMRCLDEALKIEPRYTIAWSNKGANLNSLERYEEAIHCCDEALEIDPSHANAWLNKGNSLNGLGHYEESIRCYDKTLEIDPRYASAWNNKGINLKQLRRYEESIRCLDEALKIEPRYTDAWINKGINLNLLGRYEESIRCYDEALKIDPRGADTWNDKGNSLNELGRYEEAIRCYGEALEIDPSDAGVWNNKGNNLNQLGRHKEAIHCYDKALEINPRNSDAWGNKGNSLNGLGRYEEAIHCCDEALEIDPSHVNTWINKGINLKQLRRYEEAVLCFDEVLEINPRDSNAWFHKGNSLNHLGHYEESIRCYDETLKIDPRYANAWGQKGVNFERLGRYEEAVWSYEQSLALVPAQDKEKFELVRQHIKEIRDKNKEK